MLDSPISDELPATVLKLHPNFTVICDKDAASLLNMDDYKDYKIFIESFGFHFFISNDLEIISTFWKEKVNKAFICYNFSILEDYL